MSVGGGSKLEIRLRALRLEALLDTLSQEIWDVALLNHPLDLHNIKEWISTVCIEGGSELATSTAF